MPEWLVEQGIGETRAALIEQGEIVEARILRQDVAAAGTVLAARLRKAGRNAIAEAGGDDYLLPHGAPGVAEGGALSIEVVREDFCGTEPWKRPVARITPDSPHPAKAIEGRALPFPSPADELGAAGWLDLIDEARSATVRFPGGALRISPTPAMTLIDVDGTLEPEPLAIAGASAAARAIRRLDIGGSIGIDLPTVAGKAARTAAAKAIDARLEQPFERTAVNGFGFVQIVRPRQRPSLVELFANGPAAEARALLRSAAMEPRIGSKTLVAHPAVIAALEAHPDWTKALARQVGGSIGLRADASLPISAGHAEPA